MKIKLDRSVSDFQECACYFQVISFFLLLFYIIYLFFILLPHRKPEIRKGYNQYGTLHYPRILPANFSGLASA